MSRPYFFTSVVANYLPKARVLAKTLQRHLPGASFHVAFPDALPAGFNLAEEPFDSILTPDELGIANFRQWVFTHTIVEASTAVKGPALRRLLEKPDCGCVIYFDPDIAVLHSVDGLLQALQDSSVILTPHLTEPERNLEGILENELSVLQHGIYNLGFLGVANTENGRAFAAWWEDRLLRLCFDDIPRGLFTDQRWCDLAPAYFDGCRILREPVYNVCTWNLSHRTVTGTLEDGIRVNGEPVVFYHFSGLDSGAQEKMLARHGSAMPALWALRDWYLEACEQNGQSALGRHPWQYSNFDNGVAITKKQRRLYRDRGDLQAAFPDPFRTDPPGRSYFHWYQAEGDHAAPESAPVPVSGAMQLELPPDWRGAEPYQVLVWIPKPLAATTGKALAATLTSTHAQAWWAAGPPEALRSLPAQTGIPEPAATLEAGSLLAACRLVRDRSPGHHLAVATAGVSAPKWWDLRLIWPLSNLPEAAAVSPVIEAPESSGHTWPAQALARDYEAWLRSKFLPQPGRAPSGECFALSAAALAHLTADDEGLKGWTERLVNQHRFNCLQMDDMVVFAAPAEPAPVAYDNGLGASAELPWSGRSISQVDLRPRILHVLHSWGGGLDRWVCEYAAQDVERRHLFLRSKGTWGAFGQFLELSEPDGTVLESAQLKPWIAATGIRHSGYQRLISTWLSRYGISAVYVSSWIGHSLDLLEAFPGCLAICHDYYPYCPALNITFGAQCSECQEGHLTDCTARNPHHRFFRNVPPPYWLKLRDAYAQMVAATGATLVAPSPSVESNLAGLDPRLAGKFEIVPHGVRRCGDLPLTLKFEDGAPLRILFPGSVAPNKGLAIIREILPRLRSSAQVAFVGGGEEAERFQAENVQVIPKYDWGDFPRLVREFAPHLALLPSVVPETFSFTLQEMFDLGVPVLASRIGSFEDRIEDGVNGFLAAPTAAAFLSKVQSLQLDRGAIRAVHQRLRTQKRRSPAAMIEDYQRLRPQPSPAAQSYYARDWRLWGAQDVPRLTLQCYWRGAESQYSEGQSAIQSVPFLPGTYRLQWDLRPAGNLTELRIDWADQPTFLVLQGLFLRLEGRVHDLAGPGCMDVVRHGFRCSDTRVAAGDPQSGLVLGLLGHDPQMIVPLGGASGPADLLEMSFRLPGRDEMRNLLDARIRAGELTKAEIADLESIWTTYLVTSGGGDLRHNVEQELMAAKLRVRELEGSLSWRITKPLRDLGRLVLQARAAKV